MTRVLVTGAAGFLGRRLVKALAASGSLVDSRNERAPIREICLADRAPMDLDSTGSIPVSRMQGDLADPSFVDGLANRGYDTLFHLASSLTLEAEEDPARAFAVNVEALRRLIERAEGSTVVFTSSIAVFGGALPDPVDEEVTPAPQTTYGSHKAINEFLIADQSRRKRIDGRVLRLPIVLTRPGTPLPAISDQIAGIIREPLNGRSTMAPLAPSTRIPVCSAGAAAAALIRLHDLPASALPPRRAFNLAGLTVTIGALADAVMRHGASGRIAYAPDPTTQAIVDGWPKRFVSRWGDKFGIGPDVDLDALIRDYLEHKND